VQAWYPHQFEREMGCTEAELLQWLPGAVGGRDCEYGPGAVHVVLGAGRLTLRWQALPPREIALIRLPRLAVEFAFDRVDESARQVFMRYFDLYTQRGGG
jgi:hypothetical protein